MDTEISNFIKVWLIVLISLCYSYTIGKVTHKGPLRLILLSPIVALFLYLPLTLHSANLGGLTAFFIAWLANFKILLFSFDKGPLYDNTNAVSLPHFIAISCLPIKTTSSSQQNNVVIREKSFTNYAIKGLLFALLLKVANYSDLLHQNVLMCLYCLQIYFFLELILARLALFARSLVGLELEPQFNEPYLSSSLQDFWGRRWNLAVSSILRPSVYNPTRELFGKKWDPLPGVAATFTMSALMHELMIFYMGRLWPTWEISAFFGLHVLCLCFEIGLKKVINKEKLRVIPRLVSGVLTFGFVLWTSLWLFLPPFLRFEADVKMLQEFSTLSNFLKNVTHTFNY